MSALGGPESLWQVAGQGVLTRPEYAGELLSASFDPQSWGDSARPVDGQGRGSAWFLADGERDWVLRHYSRGGLAARISRSCYVYTGARRVRSFTEFRLLNALYEAGLPVPCPVSAWFQRLHGGFYRAALITRRIPDTRSFAQFLGSDDEMLWCNLGQTIRRFHDYGVDHPDLNCNNILAGPDRFYLIDFDKGKVRQDGSRWKRNNLERLRRSIEKLAPPGRGGQIDIFWQALIRGYRAQR